MKKVLKYTAMVIGGLLMIATAINWSIIGWEYVQGAFYDSRAWICKSPVEQAQRAGLEAPDWVKRSSARFGVSEKELLAMVQGNLESPRKPKRRS